MSSSIWVSILKRIPLLLKLSGGPDGDVAGNQILNLYHHYPHTAKIIALTDGTGTIHDGKGLDLNYLKDLFYQVKGIRFYPPEMLSPGGFLVDKTKKRSLSPIFKRLMFEKSGEKSSKSGYPVAIPIIFCAIMYIKRRLIFLFRPGGVLEH